MLPWLDAGERWFPDPSTALDDPDGLLAAGADLAPQRLLDAYQGGIFPWYSDDQPILWWSPNPRFVLRPGDVKISRSLTKTLKRGTFEVTFNQDFDRVLQNCAQRDETWITNDMADAFRALHLAGWARSVEAWQDNELVGGLYGICMGRCFFGESMFTKVSDASKTAFVTLATQLDRWGFEWIDCQVETDHLQSLGARPMPRLDFLRALTQHTGPQAMLSSPPPSWPARPAIQW